MYDFYELLVNDKCSSNQACCFTVLGKQDPGEFGIKNNMKVNIRRIESDNIKNSQIKKF